MKLFIVSPLCSREVNGNDSIILSGPSIMSQNIFGTEYKWNNVCTSKEIIICVCYLVVLEILFPKTLICCKDGIFVACPDVVKTIQVLIVSKQVRGGKVGRNR